jgi:hypothetical protein
MHGSRSKIPSKKNLVRQRWAEIFNFGVKGLVSILLRSEFLQSFDDQSTTQSDALSVVFLHTGRLRQ